MNGLLRKIRGCLINHGISYLEKSFDNTGISIIKTINFNS
jgi:hypothetical protein